jgi:hypothetical protein
MMALVWIVIGIGLVSALLLGGTSLLQGTGPLRSQIKETSTSMFHALASAYQSYYAANRVAPTTAAWQTQLVPSYITELKTPITGLTWTFNTDVTHGDYFCLYGSMPQTTYLGLSDAATNFPTSSYILNTTACGQRSNSSAPSSWPTTVYITYWVKGS